MSNNWHVELAKMFKNNENIEYIGILEGTVIETNPLKISIYGGKAFITDKDLYICENVTEYQLPFILSSPDGMVSGTITHEGLKNGERVAIVATESNQKFFVIDKVI
ncbi:DUF2577 family protein [Clostridium sp.]|uniref:DUF2577 family protein n=1 Tax=Clostridium sp. TaxID=1506 RepID=UPI002FDDB00D